MNKRKFKGLLAIITTAIVCLLGIAGANASEASLADGEYTVPVQLQKSGENTVSAANQFFSPTADVTVSSGTYLVTLTTNGASYIKGMTVNGNAVTEAPVSKTTAKLGFTLSSEQTVVPVGFSLVTPMGSMNQKADLKLDFAGAVKIKDATPSTPSENTNSAGSQSTAGQGTTITTVSGNSAATTTTTDQTTPTIAQIFENSRGWLNGINNTMLLNAELNQAKNESQPVSTPATPTVKAEETKPAAKKVVKKVTKKTVKKTTKKATKKATKKTSKKSTKKVAKKRTKKATKKNHVATVTNLADFKTTSATKRVKYTVLQATNNKKSEANKYFTHVANVKKSGNHYNVFLYVSYKKNLKLGSRAVIPVSINGGRAKAVKYGSTKSNYTVRYGFTVKSLNKVSRKVVNGKIHVKVPYMNISQTFGVRFKFARVA
ncbi:NEAT domain-containing protein [Lentilactobacillus sp. Marseille-Q4993]|uniref:NEAT domain-containing protein n=1 Tax=Lentilactobacillus sp. Marseille-Q4993 TaxID=3039492 RepID=UPI0024BCF696|nr:NEAT domain-containing protein [Lentilactobacillus sp. Marseille-Q4993]